MADITNSYQSIEKIAGIMNENGLTEIEVETDEIKIYMAAKRPPNPEALPFIPYRQHTDVIAQSAREAIATASAEIRGNVVKSPIVGTFYAAPAPDKSAFAGIGDRVERGQVVCIIESMKLMNEITSEFSGTVTEIYVNDGDPVEFDQKLMRIE